MSYSTYVMPPLPITHKSVMNTGFLLALVGIIFALIPAVTDIGESSSINMILSFISMAIAVVIFYVSLKKYRDTELGGYMSLGRGFQFVFFTSIYIGLLVGIFMIIQMKFIDPGMMDEVMNTQMAEMEKQGMTEEQMEMASKFSGYFTSPFAIGLMTFFGQLFWGAIIGLILGAILKNWPPPARLEPTPPPAGNEETTI